MNIEMRDLAERIAQAKHDGKRVYLCGNGGSAANAIHIANDWLAVGVRALALTNLSTITAIANDHGYEYIFAKQLSVYAEAGDILVVLSGSGESQNVIQAAAEAERLGMDTYAITSAGRLPTLVKATIFTAKSMQTSEETQLQVGHYVADYIKARTH